MKQIIMFALTAVTLSACPPQSPASMNQPMPNLSRFSAPQNLRPRSDEGLHQGVLALRKQRFQKWDKNFNGELTRDEVSDENMKIPGIIEGFHSYDLNHDDKIVMDEFLREDVIEFWMGLIRPKLDEQFSKHDQDGNRLITSDEQAKLKLFFSPWPKLNGGDLNGDKVITFSEYEDAYMTVLPFFQQSQELFALPDSLQVHS